MSLPQPPWTQAPSEVIAWRSSTGGGGREPLPPHRPARVRGYETRLPASDEPRLLARIERLGLNPVRVGRVHLPHLIPRLAHHGTPEIFVGRVRGLRLRVRLQKGRGIQVRMTFMPQTSFGRAWRLVSRLGLHPTEGTWT